MLFKEFGGIDAFPICLDTKDPDEIVATVEGGRSRLRRHQPRGHLRAALLRDRGAPQGRARHPGLPRRPARHRGRRAGRADQRAEDRRQADGGPPRRGHRPGRGRRRGDEDPARGGRQQRRRLRLARRAVHRAPRLPGRLDAADQALVRRALQPRQAQRRARRRPRGRRPAHRALRAAGSSPPEALDAHEPRRDGLRHGQPRPGGQPRGGRAPRADHGHRALGLPQPDQQRALLPRHLPRRARRPRAPDHRRDEDGRRARRSPRSCPPTRAARGLHHPLGLQPRRRSGRGRRGRRARPAARAPPRPATTRWATRRPTPSRSPASTRPCRATSDPPDPAVAVRSADEGRGHRRDRPHRHARSSSVCARAATR